jgi:hypothetical protein
LSFQRDVEAESFEPFDESTFESRRVKRVEVVGAEVAVTNLMFEHVVRDPEQRMGDGDRGALDAATGREAAKEGR